MEKLSTFHNQQKKDQHNKNHELELGDCEDQSRWSQEGQDIKLVAISKCIKTIGDGSPRSLSNDCKSKQSSWKTLSASNLHLGTIDGQCQNLCLEREPPTSSKIVTKRCICVDDNPACLDNPQKQWFQLVTTKKCNSLSLIISIVQFFIDYMQQSKDVNVINL